MTDNVPRSAPSGAADEIDFEIDAEDLPDRAVRTELGEPSVIVDDVHVTYRVFGGKPVSGTNRSLFNRVVGRARKHVGAITEVRAVRGVSFVARHGEAIGIVGTNGSGKSTLLRAVAGLHPPTKGRVYISGEPSLLGVNAALLKDLSGERNITIGGLALGMTENEARAKVPEIVEFADLGDFVYLPMSAYSSGMAARLRFAISTIVSPEILMVDEALATGDAAFRQKSKERIERIREEAGTVFLVSHSIASVRAMCTRVIWLDQGKVRMDGDVDAVCDEYQKYIKSKNGKAQAGGKIGSGSVRKGSSKSKVPGKAQAKSSAKVAGQPKPHPRASDVARPATGSLRKVAQMDSRPGTGAQRQVANGDARPATGSLRKVTQDDARPSTGALRKLTWDDVRPERVGTGDADPLAAPETRPVVRPAVPPGPRWPASSQDPGVPESGAPAPAEVGRQSRPSWASRGRSSNSEPAPETEAIPIVTVADPRHRTGESEDIPHA